MDLFDEILSKLNYIQIITAFLSLASIVNIILIYTLMRDR